jgi:hypothetical protein
MRLSTLPAFMGLDESVASEPDAWRPLYDATEPHRVVFPGREDDWSLHMNMTCVIDTNSYT